MPDKQPKIAENSRYALVMVTARRARQLMKEATAKGVAPSEVSLVNIGNHKPVKLALAEVTQGAVGYKIRKDVAPSADLTEEATESSIEPSTKPSAKGVTETATALKEEVSDANE